MSLPPPSAERLFIALTPPDAVRTAVAALQTPLRNVRWTPHEQLHLTVRFLGNLPVEQSDDLITRLQYVRVKAFPLAVEGTGLFPQRGAPRVLWAGVGSGHPRLHQLRQQIDNAVLSTDASLEVRAFHPHFTVGRCTEAASPAVTAWARAHRDFAGPVFSVESFELYASDRGPTGSDYRLLAKFTLDT